MVENIKMHQLITLAIWKCGKFYVILIILYLEMSVKFERFDTY